MTALRTVLSSCALFCLAIPSIAFAQSDSRLELAGQATMLRLNDLGTSAGFGGRVTFDLTNLVAIEAEVNLFPSEKITQPMGGLTAGTARLAYHRRRTDLLVGAKVGHRGERFGLFARVRPGVARLTDRGLGCDGEVCALILVARPQYRTEFAFDVGGTVEFYPSARSVARFDLGDVMIRHRSFAPPCTGCTSHNFTSRFGAGFRF